MPFLTLVVALQTAFPNKVMRHVAPSARDVSLIKGDSSHTCVIRYQDVNLYVERSMNPAVEKRDHYYSIKAEVTKKIGGKLYTRFYLYDAGDEARFYDGPSSVGRYLDKRGDRELIRYWFNDVNPFFPILRAIMPDIDASRCDKVADYIEQHPDDMYIRKPRTKWVREFLLDKQRYVGVLLQRHPEWVTLASPDGQFTAVPKIINGDRLVNTLGVVVLSAPL
ncbi:hypothetical protein FOZ63_002154 [Perkinsus olseni]|uniref:Uncharacterized protein n=1 Tax=Perkinsus olseni TaxID=32597 RepID=A0A7J6UKT9_PEROL|nr:hypothetical protein FOZ63_002154 [Perkinsus olseni]